MTKNGLTGPSAVFEGPQGFNEAVGGEISIDGLGIEENGYFRVTRSNIKSFACGFWMQAIVEAVQNLREEHGVEHGEIKEINVGTFKRAMGLADDEKWNTPLTRETADHSIPYTVSVAFIDGTVGPDQYSPSRLKDPSIHDLMETVTVEEVDELNHYRDDNPTEIPQIVQVSTPDGSFKTRVDTPKGHWKNPMSAAELEMKFEKLTQPLLTQEQRDGIIKSCFELQNFDDMEPLLSHLVI
jgi:2-methylcitrate dehydratase